MKRALALCVALAMPTFNAWGHELAGHVVGVTDGDTITVLAPGDVQERIRLAGIDAPEKAQPFGNVSKEHLSGLVFGKDVVIEWAKRDRYGRIVGKVLAGAQDVCLEQVKAGLAWHFKRYESEQLPEDRAAYSEAEDVARTGKVGLWSEAAPMPPWDWRKNRWGMAQ